MPNVEITRGNGRDVVMLFTVLLLTLSGGGADDADAIAVTVELQRSGRRRTPRCWVVTVADVDPSGLDEIP